MSELPCELKLALQIVCPFLIVDANAKVTHIFLILVHHGLRYVPTDCPHHLAF